MGVERELIEAFARAVVADVDACVALFTDDAHYQTVADGQLVSLKGHGAIGSFVAGVPMELRFIITSCEKDGAEWVAGVRVESVGQPPSHGAVRFQTAQGRISRLRVLPGREPDR